MKKLIIRTFICILPLLIMSADNGSWNVSGTFTVNKQGTVYLSLLNETGFKNHYKYIRRNSYLIGPDELREGKLRFEFIGIPAGEYAISAFLDENGNGKLDTGILGPVEPWGNYRKARPPMRGPKWEELVFKVDRNIKDVEILIDN